MTRTLAAVALSVLAWPILAARADDIDFNRDIRPILSDKCYHCHGPDEQNRKSDLRLDTAEGAAAALAGATPEAKKFFQRITTSNEERKMPPREANFTKELTAGEIATLKNWIAGGAKYARHWSFEPPAEGKIPDAVHSGWNHPIDRFVAARLARTNLKPSPRVDKATLIRRVTLDLTGLPPTPAEVNEFLKDESPNALKKVVDRLLASPRFGERMAVFWMDLARYGDSSVYHADGKRDMWAWRDGVIRSFNQNQPFDQFTIEQLAGDLLPNATLEQKVASAFNRNHATTDEGGVIAEEFRVDYVVDRVKTVSSTWLAMSLECGQCHDHKYDPISQREYYEFYAFFNNTKDGGMQTRGGNAAPLIAVPDPEAQALLKAARDRRREAESLLAEHREKQKASAAFREWAGRLKPDGAPLPRSPEFFLPLDERDRMNIVASADGRLAATSAPIVQSERVPGGGVSIDGKSSARFADFAPIKFDESFTISLWALAKPKKGGVILSNVVGDDSLSLVLDEFRLSVVVTRDKTTKVVSQTDLTANKWQHVVVSGDPAKLETISIYVDGQKARTTLATEPRKGNRSPEAKPQALLIGEGVGASKFGGALDDLAIFRGRFSDEEVKLCAGDLASRLVGSRMDDPVVVDRYLRQDSAFNKLLGDVGFWIEEERKAGTGTSTVMVMEDMPAMRPTYILSRGRYDQPLKDKPVKPGVPAAFPPMPKDAPPNRLGLARWLVQPGHPLTARVAVNRFWQILFGEGLVRTTEDFGLQGEMPSHPELLDWLAVDFVKNGWDVKRAIKQIVLSETYCQDSKLAPNVREADPENRLLARGPRVRLQGEFIRDSALFVSGLMVEKIGGRSVKPYQPPGLWEEVTLSGEKYVPDKGERLYRRSMYTYWKRSAPHPTLLTFDAPTREKCTGYRPRTNTPLQALVTLNDPQFVEAARAFAQRIIKGGGATSAERIQFAFAHALGRKATERELSLLEGLLSRQQSRFTAEPAKADALLRVGESPRDSNIPAVEHAAWTMVASAILNLDEFLVKN